MSEYRDYGTIGDLGMTEVSIDKKRYSQVYQATHQGDGENSRLPYMRRSFISFSYGEREGKRVYIEDFNLLATISSDRWERDGYSSFNDLTTTYDNLDGQQYWNTHYKTNTITFKLATDGIDQYMLEEFLHWFSAGITRELILSEHPNRAQLARVAEPPQLSLLPFEGHTTIMVSGVERDITTTLFKGEITLKLITDDPHWYAKDNILGKKVEETDPITGLLKARYIDYWTDANDQEVYIFASQDALKILYEDGIPLGSMIENNMLLGNKAYANVENDTDGLIWSEPEGSENFANGVGARCWGTVTAADRTGGNPNPVGTYVGKIAGAIVDVSGNGISSLAAGTPAYFYYAGTAPSPATISFSIVPTFNAQGYFTAINNSFTSSSTPYNTFTITSETTQELKFTTPNLITSYNQAVEILQTMYPNEEDSLVKIRKEIVKKVRHPAVREWANSLLSGSSKISDNISSTIAEKMSSFFKSNSTNYMRMHFVFNSKTGSAIGSFSYREPTSNLSMAAGTSVITSSTIVDANEDVGDMLVSNNLMITDRNYPNEYGKIVKWQDTLVGHKYSHKISHDITQSITELQIEYQNMYL